TIAQRCTARCRTGPVRQVHRDGQHALDALSGPRARLLLDALHVELTSIAALLTVDKRQAKSFDSVLVLLQQTKTCSDDLAGRSVPAPLDLPTDEVLEVITECDASVLGHLQNLPRIPTYTKLWFLGCGSATARLCAVFSETWSSEVRGQQQCSLRATV